MYICVFIHVCVYTYTYLCICIYTYTCILTYGKTYTELQARVCTFVWRAHINILHIKNTMQHSATHQSINHEPKANLGSDLSRPKKWMCMLNTHELISTSYVSSPTHIWHTRTHSYKDSKKLIANLDHSVNPSLNRIHVCSDHGVGGKARKSESRI